MSINVENAKQMLSLQHQKKALLQELHQHLYAMLKAKDIFLTYLNLENYHEIICEKEDFYKVKSEIEKSIKKFIYSGIEWRPKNLIDLKTDEKSKLKNMLNLLEENDDVQNIFHNCKGYNLN